MPIEVSCSETEDPDPIFDNPDSLPRGEDLISLTDTNGKGRGIVASKKITEGQKVLTFGGDVLRFEEITDLTHCIQNGPNTYLGPSGDLDDYVNHSCDPNCKIDLVDGELILIAVKDISKGEEITYDYSTSMNDGGKWSMKCCCESKKCRRLIVDFPMLPKGLQEDYIKRGMVPPFAYR